MLEWSVRPMSYRVFFIAGIIWKEPPLKVAVRTWGLGIGRWFGSFWKVFLVGDILVSGVFLYICIHIYLSFCLRLQPSQREKPGIWKTWLSHLIWEINALPISWRILIFCNQNINLIPGSFQGSPPKKKKKYIYIYIYKALLGDY